LRFGGEKEIFAQKGVNSVDKNLLGGYYRYEVYYGTDMAQAQPTP
jgi:hypothetical protein